MVICDGQDMMGKNTSLDPESKVRKGEFGNVIAGDDYAELRTKISRALNKICPPHLADQREDLAQIALVRVMELQQKSEGKRQFNSSYLWKVAYSALIDELRRRRRRGEVPIEEDDDPGVALPADHRPDPGEQAAIREIGQGIKTCLARLIEPRRLAVTLYLQGHSVPQAAEILGWTPKRAENLVYRGLADLRHCLTERGLNP